MRNLNTADYKSNLKAGGRVKRREECDYEIIKFRKMGSGADSCFKYVGPYSCLIPHCNSLSKH